MIDQYGRAIDYLRISVTDRCNLRCVYCIPQEGIASVAHDEILTYEEIARIVRAAAAAGITKIKITGGEPLVRKRVSELIRIIKSIDGIRAVTLTTNGVLFPKLGRELAGAGLDGVNFSLDSLNPNAFFQITRRDALPSVLNAVSLALKLELPTRINCVPIAEYGEADVTAMAELAKRYPVDVRFIELMPIGLGRQFTPVPNGRILQALERRYGAPAPSRSAHGNGPAVYYDFEGFQGSIGLISALSGVFCGSCNRVRLTADGMLKPCLCFGAGRPLKPLLRGGASEEQLREAVCQAVFSKPQRHHLGQNDGAAETKKMAQIGG